MKEWQAILTFLPQARPPHSHQAFCGILGLMQLYRKQIDLRGKETKVNNFSFCSEPLGSTKAERQIFQGP